MMFKKSDRVASMMLGLDGSSNDGRTVETKREDLKCSQGVASIMVKC